MKPEARTRDRKGTIFKKMKEHPPPVELTQEQKPVAKKKREAD